MKAASVCKQRHIESHAASRGGKCKTREIQSSNSLHEFVWRLLFVETGEIMLPSKLTLLFLLLFSNAVSVSVSRLGRYKTLLVSLTLSVVFGVLVCVSPYPSIFIVMRFCLAAASAGVYLTLYITRECFSLQPSNHQLFLFSQAEKWWRRSTH